MKKNFTDLGHGGNDSGAIGINNTCEKNIVLEVGKIVDSYLKHCNLDNKLSRNKDLTLSLSSRSSASNKYNADTFVSLHCNAYKKESGQGLEIIYMSNRGKELAKCILDELVKEKLYTKLREGNTGLKYQNVHVCRETKATACLVELGFITNNQDYNLIMNNKDKFAKCIAKGICKYNKVEFKESIVNSQKTFKKGDYSGKRAKVTANALNVRYDRGTQYNVIGKLGKGDVVKLSYCLNGWVSIEGFKGNKGLGYVSTEYLELI